MQAFRFFLAQWRGRRISLISILVLISVAAVMETLLPYTIGRLVDFLVQADRQGVRNWRDPAFYVVVMAGLGLAVIVIRDLAFRLTVIEASSIMVGAAQSGFEHVQRLSTDWHTHSLSGSLTRKISRGMWAVDTLTEGLLTECWTSLLLSLTFVGILMWHWPLLGGISLAGALLYLAVTCWVSIALVMPPTRRANITDSLASGVMGDALACQQAVKAFAAEDVENQRVSDVLMQWRAHTRSAWHWMTSNYAIQRVLLLALRIWVTLLAVYLWSKGEATAGEIVFVLTGYGVLDIHLSDLGRQVRVLQRALNEMEGLAELHDQPVTLQDAPGAKPLCVNGGAIAFEQVDFAYPASAKAIYTGFDLSVNAGERVGLVGSSGSGKSTFVKLLHRLYDVENGVIRIDGQRIDEVSVASLRRAIAVVPQDPVLFHRSIEDNIAYARPDASPEEIRQAARLAEAHGFIEAMPQGYRTLVGERGIRLSGGERQRIALARAFLADAKIVVFDEATASLDNVTEREIERAMRRLMEGRTTLTIAHRLSTVRAMDRILVFDQGKVVEQGTHDSLMSVPRGAYRRLVAASQREQERL
jgi:ATP-binding cassette subfamily B protein